MDWLDWLLLGARVVAVFFALLVGVMLVIWIERKVIADMQTRIGPNRAGPFGLLVTLADGVKLFFKEGVTPAAADRPVYVLAPIIQLIPAFLAFAVIPFGTSVTVFGRTIPFQIADLNVGILWVLAMGSLAVYGIVLAGWSSGSNYPLLGSIRSSAQLISYEVGMGLGIVAVLMYTGSLLMSDIVAFQARHFEATGFGWLPKWNVFAQFPAFAIYATAALAETNRPPFDLPEAETELVAGYSTEYSGIKFAMFYLSEYLHTITISAIGVTLFFGGWRGPQFSFLSWLWPLVWFLLKVFLFVFVFVWIRATLPRFRYDRLMNLGWKVLIPIGLFWVLATGAIVVLPDVYGPGPFRTALLVVAAILLLLYVAPLFNPRARQEQAAPADGQAKKGGST
ncbi:MAG TPA: NADH-quinone oxidoreductase subunit NuoH [Actinomycetota bacterium]|nr:NADH-quinone oxidoreductase subunit NuoH [Actinomycetota bacterium]